MERNNDSLALLEKKLDELIVRFEEQKGIIDCVNPSSAVGGMSIVSITCTTPLDETRSGTMTLPKLSLPSIKTLRSGSGSPGGTFEKSERTP